MALPDKLATGFHSRLLDMLEAIAERIPDQPALVHLAHPLDTCPKTLSFGEMIESIRRAASSLRSCGVGPDDAVAILSPTTPDTLIAFVAASTVGVAFPVNPLLPPRALAQQLCLAKARACVAYGPDAELPIWELLRQTLLLDQPLETIIELPASSRASIPADDPRRFLQWSDLLAPSAARVPDLGEPDRVAALFHTGGTSGNPKLAELGEGALAAGPQMAAAACAWLDTDRVLSALPHFHVGGTLAITLAALSRGASVYTVGRFGGRDPRLIQHFWTLCSNHRISVPAIVPTSWSSVLAGAEGDPPATLRGTMTGGAAAPADLVSRVESVTAVPMSQVFGMTELAGICSAQPLDGLHRAHAVGFPAPGLKIAMDPIAPGLNEVRIGGPNLFLGYRTADGRVGAPGEWIRSGDLGAYGEDGQLHLLGRSKDVIIRSGHNIDPAAIEEAAYAHAGVRHAAAVGLPDHYAGEVPILFVVAEKDADLSDLEAVLGSSSLEPPARPRRIVVIDDMPLTPIGKIERYKLRQRAAILKATDLLASLPPHQVACEDLAARAMEITWEASATGAHVAQADALLAEAGLRAVHKGPAI